MPQSIRQNGAPVPPIDPEDRKKRAGDMRAAAVAWTLPFSLVVPMVVCGALGYLLDRWLHTKLLFMFILGFVGLGIGLREAIKTASMLDKK
ncbi:MAG TPA: AtpZ/AtpI family protein [Candidatus Acidoferrales bacterium]|jgi:F0F1-type ATP synthase assembly protein I|nr:AtpZ/AtpI family protein [Candidatus Acidoferrales bacterium]